MPAIFQPQKNKKPRELGLAMPAEWHPHEATWLAWPHNAETWPGKLLKEVRDVYLQMVETLLASEKVHLLVNGTQEEDEVLRFLKSARVNMQNLILHRVPNEDVWIRDYGPIFLTGKEKQKAWCKWTFNAWGEKYDSLKKDNQVFETTGLVPFPSFQPGIVLEGGSIEVNGAGTCLTTEQCLLNPNRNRKLSRQEIETFLEDYLGVRHVVWLGNGIAGDDTDGHIDDIARFVNPNTIILVFEENADDTNHKILRENRERLQRSEDQDGKKLNVVELSMPRPVVEGDRLPASYANFFIANKAVLVPVFKDPQDDRAIKILSELFPKHEIVPINCLSLVHGLGAIHCVTQQEPAA